MPRKGPSEVFDSLNAWNRLAQDMTTSARVFVATAYLTDSSTLPLKTGDVLVVDASDATLRSGSTHPRALSAYKRRGVLIWSVRGLHAKVYVRRGVAWIGSMNLSKSSLKGRLVEVAARLTDPPSVKQAQDLVTSFTSRIYGGEFVDQKFLRRARKVYRPPTYPNGEPPIPRTPAQTTGWWVLGTHDLSPRMEEKFRDIVHRARRMASKNSPHAFKEDSALVETIKCSLPKKKDHPDWKLAQMIKPEDNILEIYDENDTKNIASASWLMRKLLYAYEEDGSLVLVTYRSRQDRDYNARGTLAKRISKKGFRVSSNACRLLSKREIGLLEDQGLKAR